MANIKIPRKQFEKEIGKLDEKMQHKIAMFGTTLESFDSEDMELEINPDRPDMLSYQGFKRSFLAFLGKKTGLKEYKIGKPEKDYQVVVDSSVNSVRPYTACAIVKGLKFDDDKIKEIIDIQEKLHNTLGRKRKKVAIGIYPLEKIKLPITFKAVEPDKIKFVPLETNREMSGLEILQRHPAGRDYAHLLVGKQKFPIFIDSDENILSMPPIINSQLTGKIDEKTKDIFVECSGFDFSVLSKCLNIIVTTLADMDGVIYQMEVKYGNKKEITPNLTPEKMNLSLDNTNKLLGLDLKEKEISNLIEKMGYNYKKGQVEIPNWRTDILHEVDLIEDVAIAYGFDNFVPEIPEISTIGEEDKRETIKRKISEILAGLNMLEVSNYHLTIKDDQFSRMGIPKTKEKGFVELERSKTDYTILRKNLAHYLLKVLSENVDSEYPQRIFEAGKVFEAGKNIEEREHLAAAIAPGNFTQLKQALEYLFRMLDLKIELKEPEESQSWFIDGRAADVLIDGKKIGAIGEIHPKILKNWRIKMPVGLFEISLEDMFGKLL
ncbi:MAG: phenylalanine--tRNA ligase subunit beta [Candidatus Woesearchaeota archaeon]